MGTPGPMLAGHVGVWAHSGPTPSFNQLARIALYEPFVRLVRKVASLDLLASFRALSGPETHQKDQTCSPYGQV